MLTDVAGPIEQVWQVYTSSEDIKQWYAPSDDWPTKSGTVDVREGGTFSSRMEAKGGSAGFDFAGTYTKIITRELIEYAFDFSRFGEEVRAIDEAGCDWVHVDVIDGHFVPNITFGPRLVECIRPWTKKVLDVHLMIAPCDPYLEAFAKAGSDIITVHAEAGPHLDRSLQVVRGLGKKAGVSLNPGTPESAIAYVLDKVDLILVMSVNPGFGGQAFIPAMVEKVARVREMIAGRPIDLEVDGGVTVETAPALSRAGANVLVAGSAVFKTKDYAANIAAIRQACALTV